MTGSFGTPTVNVSATIPSNTLPPGENTVWVRGQDAAGITGAWRRRNVPRQRRSGHRHGVAGASALRAASERSEPVQSDDEDSLRLAAIGRVEVIVYDVRGARIRKLVSGPQQAGYKSVDWDGT
jgi:hypothetical protein